jgi:hypothetical protein
MLIYMSPPNGRAMKWIAVVAGEREISFREGSKEGKVCLRDAKALCEAVSASKRGSTD